MSCVRGNASFELKIRVELWSNNQNVLQVVPDVLISDICRMVITESIQ